KMPHVSFHSLPGSGGGWGWSKIMTTASPPCNPRVWRLLPPPGPLLKKGGEFAAPRHPLRVNHGRKITIDAFARARCLGHAQAQERTTLALLLVASHRSLARSR